MTNSNTLPNITNPTVTHMALKEITDLLEVRHSNAMQVVEKMVLEPEFGTATQIEYLFTANNGAYQIVTTYQLNKRQSIAVAARLNTNLLMRIIDHWQELEAVTQVIADTIQINKEDMITDDSNVNKVISDLQKRAEIGLKKYGTTTERNDLTKEDWLQHLYEELLDGAIYINAYLASIKNPN